MLSVCINPVYRTKDRADGGIRRVTEALEKYLPEFGWVTAENPEGADLIMNHGTILSEVPGVPVISACHGLYWLGYPWPLWSEDANRRVTESLIRSDACTAPSQWVAKSIQRGLLRSPTVIYHGVDIEEWSPVDSPQPFVLWNKARRDPVSDPSDMQKLAGMLPNVQFVSTLGEASQNVKIIGVHPYEKSRDLFRRAWVYLQTVRETFGIGTLEMLASGVPIVGWDFGGQREIIQQGETGILVPYGDYGMLASALQTVWNERDRYSRAAREDAILRWQWPDKIEQYAHLFDSVVWRQSQRRQLPKISIIVTCYNLAKYLPDALQSVNDLYLRDWECIVVDDCSTDETESIARSWEQRGGFTYVRTPTNRGLSGARNFGASHARGEYLLFLDADDLLDQGSVQELVDALDNDRGTHIAYGALDTIQEDGSGRTRNRWPSGNFDWRSQIAHLNQLPYASLMRRSVFDAVGGYRTRDWRAEDASFWIRATSHGFRATRVTERPVLVYRNRSGSKSGQERNSFSDADGDWTAWFPWRLGAKSGEEGARLIKTSTQSNPLLVPFGSQGTPTAPHLSWPVRHFAEPLVSVIIPVGPGHESYVIDALDSLVAQTFPEWEAIVINDTGAPLTIPGHLHAQVIQTDVPGSGAGRARNLGVAQSKAPFLFFLDSDDWLRPDALMMMLKRYGETGGYVYSDCVAITQTPLSQVYTQIGGMDWATFSDELRDDAIWRVESLPYDRQDFLRRGYSENSGGAHSVSILVATVDFKSTGGFDEKIPFWEDWKLMLDLAKLGVCGERIGEPLLTYRLSTGRRRRASKDVEDELRRILREQYSHTPEEVEAMCNCGGGGPSLQQQASVAVSPFAAAQISAGPVDIPGRDAVSGFKEAGKVRLRYVGLKSAPVPYVGKVTGKVYRASRDSLHEVIEVDPQDAEFLLTLREFILLETVVESTTPPVEVVQW